MNVIFRSYKLKARNPQKGYEINGKQAVRLNMKLNLNHTELSLCSDTSFQLFSNHSRKSFCTNTYCTANMQAGIVQSVQLLATGWTTEGLEFEPQ
jgi:hypothetical protein